MKASERCLANQNKMVNIIRNLEFLYSIFQIQYFWYSIIVNLSINCYHVVLVLSIYNKELIEISWWPASFQNFGHSIAATPAELALDNLL
jgi:hypothetical protein